MVVKLSDEYTQAAEVEENNLCVCVCVSDSVGGEAVIRGNDSSVDAAPAGAPPRSFIRHAELTSQSVRTILSVLTHLCVSVCDCVSVEAVVFLLSDNEDNSKLDPLH